MLRAEPIAIPNSKSGARLIKLANDAAWPQLGKRPLFVRKFYPDCYENVLERLKPGGRFIVRGNSGST